jgi:hypothetical protein
LKRLAAGASPAELQLGHDTSVESCTALLSHLDAHWYQLPRRSAESSRAWQELVTGGVPAAYFRVGGRTFDRQDPLGRMTFQGAQYLQTLGALTDYDRFREEAERNWPWERWEGFCEWRNAVLTRSDHGRYRWFLDQLVVARDDDRVRLGHVKRVSLDPQGEFTISLALWPGTPKSLAIQPMSLAYVEEPPMPALLLSETPEERVTMIVPPRTFNPGRLFRSMDPGPERKYRLTKLVQRGGDFERVAFEET